MGNIADDNVREQAEAVARESRSIIPCSECGDHDVNAMDDDADRRAYAIGTNLFKEGDIPGSREDFMAEIKAAIADSNIECPDCERDHGE